MIKAVIFDMDGLMFDTEKLLTRFWKEAAREYGFDMQPRHVLSIRSLAAPLAAPKLQGIFGNDFDYQKIRTRRIQLMNEYIEQNGVEIKPGLVELLDYLKAHSYKIAVATATEKSRAYMYMDSAGVSGYFDEFVCNAMVEHGKPAPDIYIKACEVLGLSPKECIALEDSPNGIRSAFDAGCLPVMVPDLSQPDEETEKLLFKKLDRLDQLIGILEINNNDMAFLKKM